jgi:hypothetical protein
LISLLALFESGCAVLILPRPSVVAEVPAIEGIVTEDGTPVAGEIVVYHWGWDQEREDWAFTEETQTSADGHFSFAGKRRFRALDIVVAGADCRFDYRFAIGNPERDIPLVDEWFLGPCAVPERLDIECDLTKPEDGRCEVRLHR